MEKPGRRAERARAFGGVLALLFLVAVHPASAVATAEPTVEASASVEDVPAQTAELALRWGIELVSLRPTAAGHMLDLRYRVVDAAKASALFGPGVEIRLVDPKTGAALKVPSPPKIGRMGQNRGTPIVGRTYFALFVNPGRSVRSGERVAVAFGDLKLDGVLVL